jgi:ABC-type tungstate transport system permease subunit
MNVIRSARIALVIAAIVSGGAARVAAQTPSAAPVTGVLTTLTVKSDIDRAQVAKVMPSEVRETMKMYLDGKISQWYARSDGKGVVFILNCASVAEAKALTDTLPLSKNNFATFEFIALTPLTPLRMLLSDPAAPPKH